MSDQDNEDKTPAPPRKAIKSETHRAREQNELARALKAAEKRERRRNENRIKHALGSLVLAKLRSLPGSPWEFGNDDLRMLSDNDHERLVRALGKTAPADVGQLQLDL